MEKIKYLINTWLEKELPEFYERKFDYSLLKLKLSKLAVNQIPLRPVDVDVDMIMNTNT